MNFNYPAITENTRQVRVFLESIGYMFAKTISLSEFDLIYTYANGIHLIDKHEVDYLDMSLFVDCRGNAELFRAVAAVCESTDYMQWFTDGKYFELCKSEVFESRPYVIHNWRKCTPNELIKNFTLF